MPNDPFHDGAEKPVLDDLEPILGERRHRNFEKIYNEISTLGFSPNIEWDKGAGIWFFSFHKEQKPIFDIYVSDDQFYSLVNLSAEDFLSVNHHSGITDAAIKLIHKFPQNQSRHYVRIEATLENMNEQEGFFDLIPVLVDILTK